MSLDFDELFNRGRPSRHAAAPIMADPAHPGDLMREIIDSLNLTVTEAAAAMKTQRSHLSAMLSGDKPVSIETAMKFEAAFGGPAPTVLHGMSDLYESTKALRRIDEITDGIRRLTEEAVSKLKATKARSKRELA